MQEIQELVHKRLLHDQKAQKSQADRHHREVEYAMGQKVLLKMRKLRQKLPRKLQDRCMGLFEVLKRLRPIAYKLDLSYSSALKMIHLVFHNSLIRDFNDNGLRQQPPPVEVDGQQEYQIEVIVGHRTLGDSLSTMYHLWVMMLLRMSGWPMCRNIMQKSCC